ncbi:STM3941 family protein [Ligilactobacillus pobuzihii]|uniref:STM3941 family protein n=1 Tax=Ligilactobacillus pobuzihii TaxID=449659 RepID=UPI0003790A1B|nr:STM3941 family protein [Ligilactobacillus pobuzihii]GEN48661.1 hypothetical protein LPO01_14530 [Ligilactobacillus pobuzihii]
MDITKPYIVYELKGKQTQLLFTDLLIVLLGLCLLYLGWPDKQAGYLIFGTVLVIIFGGLGLHLLKQFFTGKVLVKITAAGFYDHSRLSSTGKLVKWEKVVGLTELPVGVQGQVSVRLKDEANYLAALPVYKRLLVRPQLKLGQGPLNISLQNARFVTAAQLIKIMRIYRQGQK